MRYYPWAGQAAQLEAVRQNRASTVFDLKVSGRWRELEVEMNRTTFFSTALKTIVVHTVTYFVVGFLAFTIFDYTAKFAEAGLSSLMRPTDDPLVAVPSSCKL